MGEQASPAVEVAQGWVRGRRAGGVDAFLGLPFAAAPVGPLRFRAPAPPAAWVGLRDARGFGPAAPHAASRFDDWWGAGLTRQDEDCLTLNVWRPAEAAGRLPVMAFIHGGGLLYGTAAHPGYDGSALARRGDLVVVTMQYRLGVLGLLWHPALADPDAPCDGNWCLQDQIAALRWIADNIAGFGGDPGNVTLFGESAGGACVALHCLSPVSRRYFRRAIVQSAAPVPATRDQHERAGAAFCSALGIAPDAARLRALPLAALHAAQPAWAAAVSAGRSAPRPMLDGALIPDRRVVEEGDLAGLPILFSYTRDEFTFNAFMAEPATLPCDDDALRRAMAGLGLPGEMLAVYREARHAAGLTVDALSLWLAMLADRQLRCPSLGFLDRHAAAGGRGWACAVTWESGWRPAALGGLAVGAAHTIELPALFGTCDASAEMQRLAGPGTAAAGFAALLQDAWAAFARTGTPETPATGHWPRFAAPTLSTMCLGAEAALRHDPWGIERRAMAAALAADPPPTQQ